MHGDPGDLWYVLIGLTLVVIMVFAWTVSRAEAMAEDFPDRERPELSPDDDLTADWAETITPAEPPTPSRYEPLWRGTPGPKPPRPGED